MPYTSVSWPKRLESSPDTQINIRYSNKHSIPRRLYHKHPSNQKTIILYQSNSYGVITDCSSITHARCKFPCTVKNITDVIIGRTKHAHTDSICDLDFQVQKWEMSAVNMNTASPSSPATCVCAGVPLKRVTNESQPPESIQFAPYFLWQMCLFIKVNSPTQKR